MKQSLVTKKNRKVRLLRELYPHTEHAGLLSEGFRKSDLQVRSGRTAGRRHERPRHFPASNGSFSPKSRSTRASARSRRRFRERYAGRTLKLIGVLERLDLFSDCSGAPHRGAGEYRFSRQSRASPIRAARPAWSGSLRIWTRAIEDEDVLLVEDIVDTGFTLRYLLQTLAGRAPNSLAVCTFLDRNSRRIVQVPVDYPLLRDSRPVRGRLWSGPQSALPESGLCRGDETGEEYVNFRT